MLTVVKQKIRKYRYWYFLRRQASRHPPRHYYFAYGANVSPSRFSDNHMNFETVGKAVIPGHRLEFSLATHLRGMGYASIGACEGEEVWGVLYKLDDLSLALLDILEWVNYGYYDRVFFDAYYEESGIRQQVKTYAYRATRPQPGLLPSSEYIKHIVTAAHKLGYPKDYISTLEMQAHRPHTSFPMNPAFRISNPNKSRCCVGLLGPFYRLNDRLRRQLMLRMP